MTWRLDPELWSDLRDWTNLILSDGECCARLMAGKHGDARAEFRRIVEGTIPERIREALGLHGCPPEALDRAGDELLHAALAWREQRDAMLAPAEGTA